MTSSEKLRRRLFSVLGGIVFATFSTLVVLDQWDVIQRPSYALILGGLICFAVGCLAFRIAWLFRPPNRYGFAFASIAGFAAIYLSLAEGLRSGTTSSAFVLFISVTFGGLFWFLVLWGAFLFTWFVFELGRGKRVVIVPGNRPSPESSRQVRESDVVGEHVTPEVDGYHLEYNVLRSDGTESGWMGTDALREWYLAGAVLPSTLVQSSADQKWKPLGKVVDLTSWTTPPEPPPPKVTC